MSPSQGAPGAPQGAQSGHRPPSAPDTQTPPVTQNPDPVTNRRLDRGPIIGTGLKVVSQWSGRFILVAIATAILMWLLAQVWVGLLPVILALIVCTVLWPPVAFLRRRRWPAALAVVTVLLSSFLIVGGVFAALAPSVVSQSREVLEQATLGLEQVQDWLAGPPFHIDASQIQEAVNQAIAAIQERAGDIASGVFSGISAVGSIAVTSALMLVLTFFFLKDGPNFLPWLRAVTGRKAGRHLTEVLTRVWNTLGGFIRVQAVVSGVDAFFIGLGLYFLGVPLAFALAVLTFFAGFIPIVGAVTAGALACLVALVTIGWQTALWVLVLIIAVQQLEGNVLQPWLQGRSMELHAGIILLAVAGGGTLFGIPGAFLAVPVAASVVVVLRYLSEQVDLLAGDLRSKDIPLATPEGQIAAVQTELRHRRTVRDLKPDSRRGAAAESLGMPIDLDEEASLRAATAETARARQEQRSTVRDTLSSLAQKVIRGLRRRGTKDSAG